MAGPEGIEFGANDQPVGLAPTTSDLYSDAPKMKNEELGFPDNMPQTRPKPVADEESEEEELEESEEGEEEEGEEEEAPVVRKKTPVVEEGPPPETPVPYDQAYNFYRNQYIATSLRKSGFDVKEDLSNLRDAMAEAAKEDPVGWDEVKDFAANRAKVDADNYKRTKIDPFEQYHIKKGITNFIGRLAEHYTDIGDYLPEMQKAQEAFFRKWPELINDPVRALPLLYMEAKQNRAKKAKAPSTGRTTMETGGARRTTTSKKGSSKKTNSRDIDFKELNKYGTDRFVGGIF